MPRPLQGAADDRIYEPLDRALGDWRTEYALTAAEVEILRGAALGLPRASVAAARGVALGTVNKQAKILLEKTGDAKLDDAANRLLRAALARRAEPPRRGGR